VKRWGERWPGYANPLDLLPGSKFANAPYVQIEMIPCVYGGKRKDLPAPLAPGLRFTRAQHDAVAALYVDLAKRHSWPAEWWRTPRVVGHEDVTPASRHDKNGGWDPGFLRAQPYFDWPHVIREIGRLLGMAEIDDTKKPRSLVYSKPGPWSKF
jgi:N-acetyl-anhydromuramyl-L-alanine amidase AmpD